MTKNRKNQKVSKSDSIPQVEQIIKELEASITRRILPPCLVWEFNNFYDRLKSHQLIGANSRQVEQVRKEARESFQNPLSFWTEHLAFLKIESEL